MCVCACVCARVYSAACARACHLGVVELVVVGEAEKRGHRIGAAEVDEVGGAANRRRLRGARAPIRPGGEAGILRGHACCGGHVRAAWRGRSEAEGVAGCVGHGVWWGGWVGEGGGVARAPVGVRSAFNSFVFACLSVCKDDRVGAWAYARVRTRVCARAQA
eukprot:6181833-Pleurochrysis_carterae.AAC.2